MNTTSGIEERILSTITLGPIEQPVLQEIVMSRHKAGGLELMLGGNANEAIPDRKIKKLISELVATSNGNLGVAMHQWLTGIAKCEHGSIEIRSLQSADFPDLNEKDKFLILAQLVVHKHLSVSRIRRIFGLKDRNEAAMMIDLLIRSKVIQEVMGTTYKLNPYISGSLIKRLKRYKLIG
jgi:hypothetical protein